MWVRNILTRALNLKLFMETSENPAIELILVDFKNWLVTAKIISANKDG